MYFSCPVSELVLVLVLAFSLACYACDCYVPLRGSQPGSIELKALTDMYSVEKKDKGSKRPRAGAETASVPKLGRKRFRPTKPQARREHDFC